MKKEFRSLLAFLLCICMTVGALAACTPGSKGGDETTAGSTTEGTIFLCLRRQIKKYHYPHNSIFAKLHHSISGYKILRNSPVKHL